MAARGVDKSPTEIDKALTVLAYYGGNTRRAGAELNVSKSTLHLWKTSLHRERYLEIAEREGPRLEAMAVAQAREIILQAGEAEHELLGLLTDRMAEARTPKPQRDDYEDDKAFEHATKEWLNRPSSKELGEVAGTLQRITTSKGINGTKLLELTGRPTQVVEHRDPKQAAQALARRLGITLTDTDVIETPNLALPVESGRSNARGIPASTPAD